MSIETLTEQLRAFANEREWNQFHTPKNLAMALSGEVGELCEIFQWMTDDESKYVGNSEKKLQHVREEMADIFLYLLRMADTLDINLLEAAADKIKLNAGKYPVSRSKGNSKKYTEL